MDLAPPKVNDGRIDLRLPAGDHERLREAARQHRVSVNRLIRYLLHVGLDSLPVEEPRPKVPKRPRSAGNGGLRPATRARIKVKT